MRAVQIRHVVVELHARVVILDRDEERFAEAIAFPKVECGVGQRPTLSGDQRTVVRTRAIFARVLRAKFVENVRAEDRDDLSAHGIRRIALDGVGAAAPRVDVERTVLLLRPCVVVAQREDVARARVPVGLEEGDARVVGALDRSVFIRAAEFRQRIDDALFDARGIGLLRRRRFLQIDRGKVEEAIFLQRTAKREAGLILIGIELRRFRTVGIFRAGAERVVFQHEMRGTLHVVRARLRDHVDEARHRSAELRIRAVGDDDHLFHRIEIERERRTLSAALLAEERIVEVGAVDGDVVRDSLLSVDRQLIAVGSLHDRHAGRELREVEEVASVVRQSTHRFLIDARRSFSPGGFDQRRLRGDDDLLGHGGLLHLQRNGERLSEAEVETFDDLRGEAFQRRFCFIWTEREQDAAIPPRGIADFHLHKVRCSVSQRDGDAGEHRAGRVDDGAFDDAGRCLRLREDVEREESEREKQNGRGPTHGTPPLNDGCRLLRPGFRFRIESCVSRRGAARGGTSSGRLSPPESAARRFPQLPATV